MNKRSCFGNVRLFYFKDDGKLNPFHIKKEEILRNLVNNYVIIFGNSQQFCV